jgi:hypothetical protein
MTMNNTRENLVYLAKLAEQAERFDEMVPARVETRPNLEARGIRRSRARAILQNSWRICSRRASGCLLEFF